MDSLKRPKLEIIGESTSNQMSLSEQKEFAALKIELLFSPGDSSVPKIHEI
jgi:hypothetical protein